MASSPVLNLGTDARGRDVLLTPYDKTLASKALSKNLTPETDSDWESSTPDPTDADAEFDSRDGGPIRRFNDVFTDLGMVNLEALGLEGYEAAVASATLRNEMYRNQFPLLEPAFASKCTKCETEFDTAEPACPECSAEAAADAGMPQPAADLEAIPRAYWATEHMTQPDSKQKARAQSLVESVNKEGQSLRDLMRMLEDDQSRMGVSTMVVKWSYAIATQTTPAFDAGQVIFEEVDELMRGDPKRIVPVVDEDGRIGGYWWSCPIHREHVQKHGGQCPECSSKLREVYFVEKEHARSNQVEKYFFRDEIISWSRHFPRLHGLDGMSPMHLIWLKQAILHWMDTYAAAFYDPDSKRYPNKMMVVHTTNTEAWEKNFQQAEDESKENPYSEQILVNEYSSESNSTPELQVIDLMSDELLGQDAELKQTFKKDIRSVFGVTNVFDSDMSESGGLNNEGLQMEVTDRWISAAMKDTADMVLRPLERALGITDWELAYTPPQRADVDHLIKQIRAGMEATQAGLEASLEDEQVDIADGDFQAGGGMGMGMGMGFPGMGPSGPGAGLDLDGPPEDPEGEEVETPGGDLSPESLFGAFEDAGYDALSLKALADRARDLEREE